MQFDIVGGSYANEFVSMNAQRTINWNIEKELLPGEENKYKHSLVPTPGLSTFATTAATNLRGLFTANFPGSATGQRCFFVGDNVLYETDSSGTVTNRGTLTSITNDSTPVYMQVNGNGQLMIGHSSAAYYFLLASNTLTKITDGNYIGSLNSLSYGATFMILTSGGGVYWSAADRIDNGQWVSTNVFQPTAYASGANHAIMWSDRLIVFADDYLTTYTLNPTGTSPFTQLQSSTVDIGSVLKDTIKTFHGGIIFAGAHRSGQIDIYLYNGSTCQKIASSAISYQANSYTVAQINAAYADITYTKKGHIQYLLTIPASNTTYVYDIISPFMFYNTLMDWTERQSYNSGSASQGPFRGRYCTNFGGLTLWCDTLSGNILKEDSTIVTEAGQPITRTRISSIFNKENKYISIYSLELDVNNGVGLLATPTTNAHLTVSYSKDSGNTYQPAQTISVGNTTDYTTRAILWKLGTARNWVFKIVCTDAAKITLQSGIVHGVIESY